MRGERVSEPTIANATTIIVAYPKDAKVASPVRNKPAIATITVRPEMSTERPEVAGAASSASLLSSARRPVPPAFTPEVENIE